MIPNDQEISTHLLNVDGQEAVVLARVSGSFWIRFDRVGLDTIDVVCSERDVRSSFTNAPPVPENTWDVSFPVGEHVRVQRAGHLVGHALTQDECLDFAAYLVAAHLLAAGSAATAVAKDELHRRIDRIVSRFPK